MTQSEAGTQYSGRWLAHLCLFCFTVVSLFASPATHMLASSSARGDTIFVQINGVSQVPGFFPDLLTLHGNDTVVFINQAQPARNCTLNADDGSFSSPVIPSGGRWSFTFVSKGAHVYRDTTYPERMVGELLVVDRAVHLLPTPNPLIQATVIAAIRNGQSPPDTLNLPARASTAPASSPMPLILLLIGISGALIVLGAVGFAFYQRYQQRSATLSNEDEEEGTGPLSGVSGTVEQARELVSALRQKVQSLPSLRHRHENDDDEDDDRDWDQI